jgi:hypothetical protein
MSDNSITVQYRQKKGDRTGVIQVVRPGSNIIQHQTSSFYALDIDDKKATRIHLNRDDSDFMEDQRDLRALDMMKDGNVAGAADIHNQIYGIFFRGQREPKQYSRLNALEKKFTASMQNYVRHYAWTKISKDSSLDPKLSRRLVFKEAGLDAQWFIKNPYFCGNIANEVIDPAKRSQISDRNGDIVFPKNNVQLNFETGFLDLFGFSGTSLSAIREIKDGGVKYRYQINVDGLAPITDEKSVINGTRVDWFQGNKEKNDFIAYGRNVSTNIKRGLLITKEMGDVLQVLIMFVWSLMYSQNTPYTMVTNDQVVYLLCMILRVNCVVTFKTTQGSRMRNISVFEPQFVVEVEEEEEEEDEEEEEEEVVDKKAYTLARKNFRDEKYKILDQNRKFIERLKLLRSNPGKYKLYVKNLEDQEVEFSEEFYENVIRDMRALNYMLIDDDNKVVRIGYNLSIKDIREKITEIKSNFLFNMFIRRVEGKFIITFAKKYTESRNLWGFFKPSLPEYGIKAFYKRAVPYVPKEIQIPQQPIQQEQPTQQEQPMQQEVIQEEPPKFSFLPPPSRAPNPAFSTSFIPTGERSSFQFGGAEINLSPEEEEFFRILEFDNSPARFYDKETGETVDLIPFLYNDIHSALQEIKLDMYFYEFLNEILYNYYLLEEVLYRDSGLDNLIKKIIQYDIELPIFNQPIISSTFIPSTFIPLPIPTQYGLQNNPFLNQSSFIPSNSSSSSSFSNPFSRDSTREPQMMPRIDYTQLTRDRPSLSDEEMPRTKRVRVSGGRKTRKACTKFRRKNSRTQKNKRLRKKRKTVKHKKT